MRGRAILALSVLLLAGCQARGIRTEPARGDQAALYVYLHPMPDTAARLRFKISGIAAVSAAGDPVPLKLHVAEFDAREAGRQRLIASGHVPPGSYRGLAVTIASASLRGEAGEAALLVPEKPVEVSVPVAVGRGEAGMVEAAYRHEGSVHQGFRFQPALSAYVPAKPVVTRLGFAAAFRDDLLTVFDKSTLETVGVIATGRGPVSIALDERERRAYVALSQENAVEVVDIAAGRIVARVRLNAGDGPSWLALAQNGVLLCANRDSNTVSVIDGRSAVELARIPVGEEPVFVLMDRAGRRAYVFNARSNTLTVVDPLRRVAVATVATESGPIRGVFNRASDKLYVIYRDSPYLTVIDVNRLVRSDRIQVGMGAAAVHVDTDTDFIYVGKRDSTVVDVYDPFSLLPFNFIEVPGPPSQMIIDREENRLLLAVREADAVAGIDLVTNRLRGLLDVGTDPRSLEVMGARR